MQRALRYCAALAAAGSLGTSGCENFSATEAGLLAAGLAGAATGIALGTKPTSAARRTFPATFWSTPSRRGRPAADVPS